MSTWGVFSHLNYLVGALRRTIQLAVIVVISFTSLNSFALDPEVQALVDYETLSNAVARRSNEVVAIKHYEIPYKLLVKLIDSRTPPEIFNSLVFTKDGEKYVRWIINPEDTKWHRKVAKWLALMGVDAKPKSYYRAYRTASRSYIIEDPKTGVQFSAKVSTNNTGGNWTDKQQTWTDAKQVKMASDFYMQKAQSRAPQNLVFMDEPIVFGVKELDQGMIIRLLADLPKSGKYYVPGFSIMHDKTGRLLADANGSNNPAEFWNEHYNKPLGKALAELAAMTGLAYDSPHSQNFLIELDENLKPTGKIIIRDLGDSYVSKPILEAMGRGDFVKKWEKENILPDRIHVAVGIMHGNTFPNWLGRDQYVRWGIDFMNAYDQEWQRITGVSESTMSGTIRMNDSGTYFSKSVKLIGPEWDRYLQSLSTHQGLWENAGKNLCKYVFSSHDAFGLPFLRPTRDRELLSTPVYDY